ncbi:MAG: hypothetical protein QOJ26_1026 [Thermoplasmata archaeon]|nr:hypothetical protein [Thermoplasmata archaeon]
MRAVQLVLALLMVVGGLPIVSAQEDSAPQAPVLLLEDVSADIQFQAAGTPTGNPAGRFAATDLRSLAVEELKDDLVFRLGVASLSTSPEAPFAENTMYTVDFGYGAKLYRVLYYRTVADQPRYFARAYEYDAGRGAYSAMEQLVMTVDPASNTLAATVPRAILLDENGAAPFPGRVLTGFHAASSSLSMSWLNGVQFGPVPVPAQSVPPTQAGDKMPDSGNGTLDLSIKLGLLQAGNARLTATIPARASNGEANTFVFEVNATNLGPKQRFSLSTHGVPATWQVDLPSDLIELPAQSTVTFPVLISTPFAHQHGSFQNFIVEMAGLEHTGDVGRVQLGIRYTATPQPAGHHDTVYLHTLASEGDATFNTLFGTAFGFDPSALYFNTLKPEEDPNDSKAAVGGTSMGFTQSLPPMQAYTWFIPLSPALAMGLDFDLTRTGTLNLDLDTVLPMQGAQMTGRIVHTIPDGRRCDQNRPQVGNRECSRDDYYFGAGEHITAAQMATAAAVDVPPNSVGNSFVLTVAGTDGGDYITFNPDATLALQLNLTFLRADGFLGPKDMPKIHGGEMVLPLIEYHDPVDQVFTSLSSLMITVSGEQQRMVNPGKTALYELSLMNHGANDATYNLEVSGSSLPWARILGERRDTVPAGQSRPLGIAVTAPAGATDGEVADLVLAAIDANDPTARTLARLLTTVDTDAEHPDDTARVPGLADQLTTKDSPGLAPLAGLAVLGLVAVARRRRRHR